jgi:hypothetical protein
MNTNKFTLTVVLLLTALLGVSHKLKADVSNTDSFVIMTGGPSGSSYYYTVKGASANTSFSSINQSVNLLASPAVTLNGGEVKTTASGGDYQNANNYENLYYNALALFADGRAAEARTVLEPHRLVQHQLQPGQKAIAVAVLAATGSKSEAVRLARTMRSDHLTDAEYRLVFAFTTSDAPGDFFTGVEGEGEE